MAPRTANPKVTLRRTAADSTPEAWLLDVGKFPLEEPAAGWLRTRLERLVADARKGGAQNVEAFLESNNGLSDDSFPRRMSANVGKWRPKTGLGIWPAREAPRLPTKDDFEAIKPGEAPIQHRYAVVRVTTALDARMEAFRLMSDLGNAILVATRDDSKGYLQRTKDLLTPAITEPAYLGSGFYAPLLDWASVEEADSPQLERWLAGAALYVRESLEDQAVVIVSAEPLAATFETLGFQRESDEEPLWTCRIED